MLKAIHNNSYGKQVQAGADFNGVSLGQMPPKAWGAMEKFTLTPES